MRRRLLYGVVALVMFAGMTAAKGAAPSTRDLGPGCDPNRRAIATDPAGAVLSPQPRNGPVPCTVITGFGGAETRVRVTASNMLVYEPAVLPLPMAPQPEALGPPMQGSSNPSGLAVSRDQGRTWSLVKPMGMTWGSTDHQQYVDRDTGRIFWYALHASPVPQTNEGAISPAEQIPAEEAHLMWSGDDGLTWTHTTACCPVFSENPRFLTAPAPTGGEAPEGYPNVVYFCANSTIGFTAPVILGRICSRSLDGGSTWTPRGALFTGAAPQHPECGANGEKYGALDGNYPAAAPDGSLYVMVQCGDASFLAHSIDEAASWPVIHNADGTPLTIPSGNEFRIDTAGNFYIVREADNQLLLLVSTDQGRTWSQPMKIVAPGVATLLTWFTAVREPGHVVVSYYAQQKDQTTVDGYLTETRDALDAVGGKHAPVFWSSVVNGPPAPMLLSSTGTTAGVSYLDYNGADIGPDGSAWGSFIQDCAEDSTERGCVGEDGKRFFLSRGVVGRLAWPK